MDGKKGILALLLSFIAGIGTTVTPMITNYYEHQNEQRVFERQTEEMREKYKIIGELQQQISQLSVAYDSMRRENERLNNIIERQRSEISSLKRRLQQLDGK